MKMSWREGYKDQQDFFDRITTGEKQDRYHLTLRDGGEGRRNRAHRLIIKIGDTSCLIASCARWSSIRKF